MPKFILPIKSTYVSSWGLWETIRETVQNAKDEEDQNGHPMFIGWKAGVLTMHNEGADLDRKALLIGHSGKTGSDLRGKHGEGLDLALLAGVRLGRKIVIETKSERWTPSVSYSEEFGADCLAINTRARKVMGTGVTVTVEVTEDEWNLYRGRFVFLSTIADNKIVRVPNKGAILLEDSRKGQIYSRGIYVDTLPKMEYGYDLEHLDLDRDRRMVDVWNLQWILGSLYKDAMARRPELMSAKVYTMIRDGAEDTKQFAYHTDAESVASVVASFKLEHGEDAVPVSSISEAREMEHLGRRGIVVQDALRDTLKKDMGDFHTLTAKLKNEVVRSVAWADLSEGERANLTQATGLLDAISALPTSVESRLDIVEFRDSRIEGLYHADTGRISIAVKMLADPRKLLTVLVHEVAHAASTAGDGTINHVQTIESIWAQLFFAKSL